MKNKTNFFHRVNWIDGMKINKDSFIDFEDSILQQIAVHSGSGINPNTFGLLPQYTKSDNNSDISISMDGHSTVVVVINQCNAITLSGDRIAIDTETADLMREAGHILKQEHVVDDKNEIKYVVVSVNHHARLPIGEIDQDEEPTRHPFVIPSYQIDILSESEIDLKVLGSHHVTIGKIVWENGQAILDETFIPPCVSIQSHQDLLYAYTEVGSFLNSIESYCTHIVQKIYQKQQSNDLASMTLAMVIDTLTYLKSIIPTYRVQDKYASPVVMITKLMCLARTIKGSLDLYAGTGKEELLNYLTEWCDQNQGAFENTLQEMIDLEYMHTDINRSLEKVANFTSLMTILFKKLHELDFIGKKGDSKIFVKEDVIVNDDVKKRRRFFLE